MPDGNSAVGLPAAAPSGAGTAAAGGQATTPLGGEAGAPHLAATGWAPSRTLWAGGLLCCGRGRRSAPPHHPSAQRLLAGRAALPSRAAVTPGQLHWPRRSAAPLAGRGAHAPDLWQPALALRGAARTALGLALTRGTGCQPVWHSLAACGRYHLCRHCGRALRTLTGA